MFLEKLPVSLVRICLSKTKLQIFFNSRNFVNPSITLEGATFWSQLCHYNDIKNVGLFKSFLCTCIQAKLGPVNNLPGIS